MRESDCFCTDSEFKLIADIEKTFLDFKFSEEKVEPTKFDTEGLVNAEEYITELNKIKI